MKKSLFILLVALILPSISYAVITVGPSGRDYTTIQAAIDAATPGETIEVYTDTYTQSNSITYGGHIGYTATVIVNKENLTIVAAAGNTPVLDGGGSTNIAFYVEGHSSGDPHTTVIDGFEITDYDIAGVAVAVGIINLRNAGASTVKNNYIHQTTALTGYETKGAIRVYGGSSLTTVENNVIDVPGSGILAQYSTGHTFQNNKIDCNFATMSLGMYISSDAGTNTTIRYNYVTDTDYVSIRVRDSTNTSVYYNVFRNGNSRGFMFQDQGADDITEGHFFYNNTLDGFPQGIHLQGINNTEFRNNIVTNTGTAWFFQDTASTGLTITHNLAYVYTNLHDGVAGWVDDPSNKWGVNPQFVGSGNQPSPYYTLTSESAAIDSGYTHSLNSRDYDNNPIIGIRDIGAFEYQSGPETTPPDVINQSPSPGATGWLITNRDISFDVTDSTAVDSSTLLFWLTGYATRGCADAQVSCTPSGDPTTLNVVYTHGTNWVYETSYTPNVDVYDTLGNRQQTNWTFTTEAAPGDTQAPILVPGSEVPTPGSTIPVTSRVIQYSVTDDVSLNDAIFSINIGLGPNNCGGGALSCQWFNPPLQINATYTHPTNWNYNTTYTVEVHAHDTSNNDLTTTWQFTTEQVPYSAPGDIEIHIHRDP